MGGLIAIHNRTTEPTQLILSDPSTELKRICEPNAVSIFQNISIKTYDIKVIVRNVTVLRTTCEATEKLYILSGTLNLGFWLERAIETTVVLFEKRWSV